MKDTHGGKFNWQLTCPWGIKAQRKEALEQKQYEIDWESLRGEDAEVWLAAIVCLLKAMDISINADLYNKFDDKGKRYFIFKQPNL